MASSTTKRFFGMLWDTGTSSYLADETVICIFLYQFLDSSDPTVKDYTNCSDIASPVMMGKDNRQAMTICPLNICQFNSGMLRGFWEGSYPDLINNLQARGEVMYALHANYLSGIFPYLLVVSFQRYDKMHVSFVWLAFRKRQEGASTWRTRLLACDRNEHWDMERYMQRTDTQKCIICCALD